MSEDNDNDPRFKQVTSEGVLSGGMFVKKLNKPYAEKFENGKKEK